jgi:aldehyde dehydrogenase (NAD+)
MGKIADILKTMSYGPSPEASDAVRAWLAAHEAGFGLFIDGAFTAPGALFDATDPATGATLARVTQGAAADVDAAVAAARKAQPAWAALPGHERARFLYALARLVQKRERFLAVLESLDNGKPIRETRDIDIPLVARHFYHHAGWASLIESEFPTAKPVGVCGQIVPWNFPLLMLAWKIAPALACGNAVVLKPAEYTPLTALAFAQLCVEAGLPPGVVNIVTGDGTTGAALAAHRDVDKVAFTGSTEVGRLIRRATAGSGKKLSLELGGKSPFIVFDDADLDSAVEGVVDGIFFNQGQVCCAGSRLLVAEGIETRFLARLKARMATLTLGSPLDKSTDIGAIVAPAQLDRIRALVEAGRAEGAEIFQPETAVPAQGLYYPPTLACGVEPANILAREEVFGPVLAAMSFRTPEEAVALANNSRYGLAASVWTENVNRAYEVASRLKAGVVWLNSTNLFDAGAAFGGYRESGFGREGGREGLAEYLMMETLPRVAAPASASKPSAAPGPAPAAPGVDRTPKIYIGGKQARPDGGAVYAVLDPQGRSVGQAGLGNRKDIRNAVEAAAKATGWAGATAHNRAQVLYYVAENLSARAGEFAARLEAMTGAPGAAEVEAAIRRLFFYAGFADKYDGAVRATQKKFVTLAMNEPYGVMGLVCPDEAPLLALVSLVAPAIAMGNAVVVVPSAAHPLAATDFYTVLDASDVPGGVVNIVTGEADALALTLAEHDGVDALWRAGPRAGEKRLEEASAGNLKATWMLGEGVDWGHAQGREFLRRACEIKTIWTPYGE